MDGVTSVTTDTFDRTRAPGSMKTLEYYLNAISRLCLQYGAQVKTKSLAIIPGAFGGHNDPFWRLNIVLQKPKTKTVPYQMDEPNEQKIIKNIFDIYTILPFSLMPLGQRQSFEAKLKEESLWDLLGGKKGCEARHIIAVALSGKDIKGGESVYRKSIRDEYSPYGKFMRKLLETLSDPDQNQIDDEDRAFIEQNQKIGEVIFLIQTLKKRLKIDINEDELQKQPGWEIYAPLDTAT